MLLNGQIQRILEPCSRAGKVSGVSWNGEKFSDIPKVISVDTSWCACLVCYQLPVAIYPWSCPWSPVHTLELSIMQLPHSLSVSPGVLQYCHPDSTQGFGIWVLTHNGNWLGYISPMLSWGQETGGSRAGSIVCPKDAFLPCKMLIACILVIQHRLGMHEFSLWKPFWHLVSWCFDSCHNITRELGNQLRSIHFVNEPLTRSHRLCASELQCWGWSPKDWCPGKL